MNITLGTARELRAFLKGLHPDAVVVDRHLAARKGAK